jgi:hypothetical protein
MLGDYTLVLTITEEELWQKSNEDPTAKGVPKYVATDRNGAVRFYPKFDPAACVIMVKEGVI